MSEAGRRLVHAIGVVVPLAAYLNILSWDVIRATLIVGTLGVLVLEFLRLKGYIDWAIYDRLIRDYEEDSIGAYVLYAVGMTLTTFIVSKEAAIAAMLLLTLADPVAGVLSSQQELGVKQGYVLLATFGFSVVLTTLVDVPFWPAVAGGIACAAADGVKPTVAGYVLDDDFTIPVASGIAIEVVWRLVG